MQDKTLRRVRRKRIFIVVKNIKKTTDFHLKINIIKTIKCETQCVRREFSLPALSSDPGHQVTDDTHNNKSSDLQLGCLSPLSESFNFNIQAPS